MKSKLYFLLLFVLICVGAQTQTTFKIKGMVQDTTGEPLIGTTIMLLDTDTVYQDFARTEIDGSFSFKGITAGKHLLKLTYVGYVPIIKEIESDGKDIDLGMIEMKEIPHELMLVVVKAARAPIKIKGDTLEYDATTFRLPEGATLESLLKKMPGVEVDQDGNITADGKDVSRVFVEGKEFFGGDPQAATKNLLAEGVSKVQVYDDKSETEKATGQKAHNPNKAINVKLKEDYKAGAFGKVVAGVGTDDRYELKGNYNRFNDKIQFSAIGGINNTGRNGLGWNDYRGFMGQNAWNFDRGSYGFGGGRFFSYNSGDGNSLEQSIQSVFFNGAGQGLPESTNIGLNLNYDENKTKINSYYFYNQAGLVANTSQSNTRFLDEGDIDENENSTRDSDKKVHRAQVGIEQELDSLHTIVGTVRYAHVDDEVTFGSKSQSFQNETLTNDNSINNLTNESGSLVYGDLTFRKKFKGNERRRFAANGSYQTSSLDRFQNQNSINDFLNLDGPLEQVILNQNFDNIYEKDVFQGNAVYVEPIGKKFAVQTFYNFSNRQELGDRDVVNINADNRPLIDSMLTREYSNDIVLNRIGSEISYNHNGINASIGLAYQNYSLEGIFDGVPGSGISGDVDKIFTRWIPNLQFTAQPIRNSYMSVYYSVNTREPSISNLQPIVDNSNPRFLRSGNPDLTPAIDNNLGMYFSYGKPAKGQRISLSLNHTINSNQIITERTIEPNTLITAIRPINYDDENGNSTNAHLSLSSRIGESNKFRTRLRLSSTFRKSFIFLNTEINETKTNSFGPRLSFDYDPSEDYSFGLGLNYRNSKTEYNIADDRDQINKNYGLHFNANAKLFAGIHLDADFDYTKYDNNVLEVDQDLPILNASLYKRFLEGKKLELRVSAYDILDKNLNFNQWANNFSIGQSTTETLAQYFMLTVAYNVNGFSNNGRR